MIDLNDVHDIIYQIFSESGYPISNFKIKFPQSISIQATKKDDCISLDFDKEYPQISWNKLITVSAYVNGIALHETGGTLKLRYLPDIDFSYEKTEELMYGQIFDDLDIRNEINTTYTDDARRNLAHRCLEYGAEWVKIASQNPSFCNSSEPEQKELKKQCKQFITANIKEEKHGSAILTFILIYVLLPVVLKFVVERLFKKLFS